MKNKMQDGNFAESNIVLRVGDLVYFRIHSSYAWRVIVAKDKDIFSDGKKVYNMIPINNAEGTDSSEWYDSLEELTRFYRPFITKYIPFNEF